MRDGLYKVAFRTQLGEGYGVAHLHDGKVHGGDSVQFYVGSYTVDGNHFTARVASNPHSRLPGVQSVFGIDNVNIELAGTFREDAGEFRGTAREAPGVTFSATLQRISD